MPVDLAGKDALMDVLWNFGRPYRVWPYSNGKRMLVTLATSRPTRSPKCEVYGSENGGTRDLLCCFLDYNPRASSTGQPFITSSNVFLVPVWDVEYYTQGRCYFGIYRSEDGGAKWTLVFEDDNSTYANHFFESPDGSCLYIGVGLHGGGKEGRIGYTPEAGYLLQSTDHGRTWARCFVYDKPCSLYQGLVRDSGEVFVTTREQKALLRYTPALQRWDEVPLGGSTRCISYITALRMYVVSSDSSIFMSPDCTNWTELPIPIGGLYLRYPTYLDGLVHFTAVGHKSIVVATDLKYWYEMHNLSRVTSSTFARMALFKAQLYCGSELDGLLVRLPPETRKKRMTFLHKLRGGVETRIRRRLGRDEAAARLYGGS
jgi:hypothetical protein